VIYIILLVLHFLWCNFMICMYVCVIIIMCLASLLGGPVTLRIPVD
jgi:hypothetical protein